jgi:hypothetical protein
MVAVAVSEYDFLEGWNSVAVVVGKTVERVTGVEGRKSAVVGSKVGEGGGCWVWGCRRLFAFLPVQDGPVGALVNVKASERYLLRARTHL